MDDAAGAAAAAAAQRDDVRELSESDRSSSASSPLHDDAPCVAMESVWRGWTVGGGGGTAALLLQEEEAMVDGSKVALVDRSLEPSVVDSGNGECARGGYGTLLLRSVREGAAAAAAAVAGAAATTDVRALTPPVTRRRLLLEAAAAGRSSFSSSLSGDREAQRFA